MFEAVSALEEGHARGVEGEGGPVFLKIDYDMDIRISFLNCWAGTFAELTKGIRDAVLNTMDGIAGVGDLRRVALDVDTDARFYREKLVPVCLAGLVVKEIVVAGVKTTNRPQDIQRRA